MKKHKILYIVPHRFNRSPGQRFRCEHFIPVLEQAGYEITYSNMLSMWDDKYFYRKGVYHIKLFIFIKAFFIRILDLFVAHRYDIIFIYREAFMVGTIFFERALQWSGKPIVYDFDDSIWLKDTSQGNENLSWLKNQNKTKKIIRIADLVIVGNHYLAEYALQFNQDVAIIPTTIDTTYHIPAKHKSHNTPICIGWTGTSTTLKHFILIEDVLKKIKKKYGAKISIKQISNIPYENEELELISTLWSPATEIEELQKIDIGIMPLPNDEWSKGKCGFKGLQYMALEIPTIMSPVGVNTEIIEHSVNGFLANSAQEWEEYLSLLIENPELRVSIGKEGRKTIIEHYSIQSQQGTYVALFDNLLYKG